MKMKKIVVMLLATTSFAIVADEKTNFEFTYEAKVPPKGAKIP